MDKVMSSPEEAIRGIVDGSSLSVGGFGLCGIPSVLIQALLESGVGELEVFSNNAGVDDWGLGRLVSAGRLRRVVASYVKGMGGAMDLVHGAKRAIGGS